MFYDEKTTAQTVQPRRFAILSNAIIDQKQNRIRYLEFIKGQNLHFDWDANLRSRMTFNIYGLKLDIPFFTSLTRQNPSTAATLDLWYSEAYQDKAELQWRISMVMLGLILTLFAITKVNLRPRQSSWGMIVSGLLFFFCYALGLNFVQSYMLKGEWPPIIGMWPVHLLALGYIFILSLKKE